MTSQLTWRDKNLNRIPINEMTEKQCLEAIKELETQPLFKFIPKTVKLYKKHYEDQLLKIRNKKKVKSKI